MAGMRPITIVRVLLEKHMTEEKDDACESKKGNTKLEEIEEGAKKIYDTASNAPDRSREKLNIKASYWRKYKVHSRLKGQGSA